MKKPITLGVCVFLFVFYGYAQDCFNAGLESGTVDGYNTYMGSIGPDGKVVINDPGPNRERHRIMHLSDGVDPIAELYCDSNKMLPVVPPDGGRYAMRLGNSAVGAQAERILLKFTVTPDLTFFLLRYAVVLNDPSHREHEQPRFELRILDENGMLLPCGEYKVRAAANIPGFESCKNGWRVRPWTTVGFELQSYLGQTIQIEILTTDCSLGGHAGYAYFDAACKPLKLELDGYCIGNTSVNVGVTDGFASYRWNTGDTTSVITLNNPIPGTAYSVTVTSVTGCSLVLNDTLPPLQDLPIPQFDTIPDTTICGGQNIWVRPTGVYLEDIYSEELGFAADSFLLSPRNSTTYTFTTSDEFGCNSDTLFYKVQVELPTIDAVVDSASCPGVADGSIRVTAQGSNAPFLFAWERGDTTSLLTNLEAGSYKVSVTDAKGCANVKTIVVPQPPQSITARFAVVPVSCHGDKNGKISVFVQGGVAPYTLQWNEWMSTDSVLTNMPPGEYSITIQDQRNCLLKESVQVPEPAPLKLQATPVNISCTGEKDGAIQVNSVGGTSAYNVTILDENRQPVATPSGLSAGRYFLNVVDAKGCRDSTQVSIAEPLPLEGTLSSKDATCHNTPNGSATITIRGGTAPYRYTWNDAKNQTTATADSLSAGSYTVIVKDSSGCMFDRTVHIVAPPPLQISLQQDSVSCNGGSDGKVRVAASGGTPPLATPFWEAPLLTSGISQENLRAGLYTVRVRDANGCSELARVEVLEPDSIRVNNPEIWYARACQAFVGDATLRASGGNAPYQYRWRTGEESDSPPRNIQPGFYVVTVTDQKGCTGISQVAIQEIEVELNLDEASITTKNGRSFICLGDTAKVQVQSNFPLDSVRWYSSLPLPCDTCQNLVFVPLQNMNLSVKALEINGCPVTAQTTVAVNRDCGTFIPNVFSPNGDGINDYFYVYKSRGGINITSFRIFDRWGNLLYVNNRNCSTIGDTQCGWDGYFQGKAVNSGVYVYAIEIQFLDSPIPVLFTGDVTLIR